MKKWQPILLLLLLLGSVMLLAQEDDFDSFDDEPEVSFKIETVQPRIAVESDDTEAALAATLDVPVEAKNRAVRLQVRNMKRFSRLKGIDTDYLVLDVAMENILKPQKVAVPKGSNHPRSWINQSNEDVVYKTMTPPYRIPDLMRHLYLQVNNDRKIPTDLISVLLSKPLLDGMDNSVQVDANRTKAGQIAFRIPKGATLSQLSLHYYDTAYGNMVLPLTGTLKREDTVLEKLPTQPWKKMNENFAVRLSGYYVSKRIGEHQAKEGGRFEVVDVELQSRVNALLQFDPAKLFSLDVGSFTIPLHPITQVVPMGVYAPVSLAPGVNEHITMVFYVPKGLEKEARSLRAEVQGKDFLLPIKQGNSSAKPVLAQAHADGISMQIHRLFTHHGRIGVEVTFSDEEDGASTRLHLPFYLHEKSGVPNLNRRKARSLTSEEMGRSGSLGGFANHVYKGQYPWYQAIADEKHIVGMGKSEVIFDGTKRRMVIWFENQFDKDHTKPWHLVSTVFRDLDLLIDKAPPKLGDEVRYAIAERYPYTHREDAIAKEVRKRVAALRASRAKAYAKQKNAPKVVRVEKEKRLKRIDPVSAGYVGEQKLKKIKSIAEMVDALKALAWVPSAYEPTMALYSPASTLTQGWGSENEMFRAVYEMLKHKPVKFGSVALTEEGREVLAKRAGGIPLQPRMPFIEWEENGKARSLVFPFFQPLADVGTMVADKTYLKQIARAKAKVKMTLTYTPANDGSSVGSFGMFGSALGGATTQERTDVLFEHSWDLAEVSDRPVDVFFPEKSAYYVDANGTHVDTAHAISFKKVTPSKLQIEVQMLDGMLDPYLLHFQKGMTLQDLYITLGMSVPDMDEMVLEAMEEAKKARFAGVKENEIDAKSRAEWLNHIKLYRFVGLQTKFENDLAGEYGIIAKRHKRPRVMIAMLQKEKKKLRSTLDLRRVFNDTYGDEAKCRSFNIISGFYNAEAEAKAVVKGEGVGERIHSAKRMLLLPDSPKKYVLQWMQTQHVPQHVIDRYAKSKKIWLFPSDAKSPLAWFEADPQTYEMVPVLENGMYGSMTERGTLEALNNEVQYFVGLFAGIQFSEFSVTAVSIIDLGQDYCRTRKAAEALSNYVACTLAVASFIGGIGDDIIDNIIGGAGTGLGCVGQSTASKAVSWGSILKKSSDGTVLKMSKALGGFANGFGDGVSLYFSATGSTCK